MSELGVSAKERERKRDQPITHWFIPQMATRARFAPGQNLESETPVSLPHGCRGQSTRGLFYYLSRRITKTVVGSQGLNQQSIMETWHSRQQLNWLYHYTGRQKSSFKSLYCTGEWSRNRQESPPPIWLERMANKYV